MLVLVHHIHWVLKHWRRPCVASKWKVFCLRNGISGPCLFDTEHTLVPFSSARLPSEFDNNAHVSINVESETFASFNTPISSHVCLIASAHWWTKHTRESRPATFVSCNARQNFVRDTFCLKGYCAERCSFSVYQATAAPGNLHVSCPTWHIDSVHSRLFNFRVLHNTTRTRSYHFGQQKALLKMQNMQRCEQRQPTNQQCQEKVKWEGNQIDSWEPMFQPRHCGNYEVLDLW